MCLYILAVALASGLFVGLGVGAKTSPKAWGRSSHGRSKSSIIVEVWHKESIRGLGWPVHIAEMSRKECGVQTTDSNGSIVMDYAPWGPNVITPQLLAEAKGIAYAGLLDPKGGWMFPGVRVTWSFDALSLLLDFIFWILAGLFVWGMYLVYRAPRRRPPRGFPVIVVDKQQER